MKNKQSGFSILETLLVIIALAVVSSVGYYVWTNQTKADVTNKESTHLKSSDKQTSSTPTATVEIALPELGISLTLPAHFSDLTHVIKRQDGDGTNGPFIYAYLSSRTLAALDSGCSTEALGTLTKIEGQYQQPVDNYSVSGRLVKQFSDFNINYTPVTQYSCSKDAKVMSTVDSDVESLRNALTAANVKQL